jgi:hypothetical protein
MRKTINKVRVEGRLYDISKLALKKVENKESAHFGEDFIGGSIDVATDEEGLNIVTVNFTFVQPTYKSGKTNATYGVLKSLIETGKTIIKDGADNATLVRVDAALGLNDFYTDRNGEETLVSAKTVNGSFVNIINKLNDESARSTFECDMLINGTTLVEANEERHIDKDYLIVKGAIFDFRNAIMPIEFIVKNEGGMKYFEGLNASAKEPVFTKVWGQIHSENIVNRVEQESAFGEPTVKEYSRTVREYIVTGTSKPDAVYEVGNAENGITEDEVKKALADREVYLAGVKKRQDDYNASKNSGAATAPAAAGGFNF